MRLISIGYTYSVLALEIRTMASGKVKVCTRLGSSEKVDIYLDFIVLYMHVYEMYKHAI